MSLRLLSLQNHLRNVGLLGPKAVRFGAPDEIHLLSGGPATHLAQYSMLMGPARLRVLVRQPKRATHPAAEPHSPLKGEIVLIKNKEPFVAVVEEWKHGCWYHLTSLFASSLDEVMEKLKPFTPQETFQPQPVESLPKRPFWSGALAYDMVQWTQPIRLQHPPKEDELLTIMWLIDKMLVVNIKTDEMSAVALCDDPWAEECSQYLHYDEPLKVPSPPAANEEKSSLNDAQHIELIQTVRNSIREGQLYQLNVGRWWNGDLPDHPRTVFHRLTLNNPAPFSAYIEAFDLGFALASSSPETLLKCDGETLHTAPIKGTRPRGSSDEEEARLRQEMIDDEKERAEHRMLVDLMRNDIGAVSKVGSVQVKRFDVEAYANVQHLVSQITGTLEEKQTGVDALQAVFPGGSITGCPRTVVCAAIDELEQIPRSFWTGSAGWIDVHSGECSWNILIRTLQATLTHGRWKGAIAAGGGITIGSEAANEVEEAKWKAMALRRACGWIDGTERKVPTRDIRTHSLTPELAVAAENNGSIRYEQSVAMTQPGVLLIDNLDSFTLNIAHSVAALGHDVTVIKARQRGQQWDDTTVLELLKSCEPTHIILGPGPGTPEDSPLTMTIARCAVSGKINTPVLGICLGHQAIGMADGMNLVRDSNGPIHGSPRACHHSQKNLFQSIESPASFTRYNSLCLTSNPNGILIETAHEAESETVMALRHPSLPVYGVQFHPESIGSKDGLHLLQNFLQVQADA